MTEATSRYYQLLSSQKKNPFSTKQHLNRFPSLEEGYAPKEVDHSVSRVRSLNSLNGLTIDKSAFVSGLTTAKPSPSPPLVNPPPIAGTPYCGPKTCPAPKDVSPGKISQPSASLCALRETMDLYGWKFYGIMTWIFVQLALFAIGYDRVLTQSTYSSAIYLFGIESLRVSRAAVIPINFCSALVLLPMCKIVGTRLASFVRWRVFNDHGTLVHSVLGVTLIFWGVVHSAGHVCNLIYVSSLPAFYFSTAFLSPAWITGLIMIWALFTILLFSLPFIRNNNFELFKYSHCLFVVYYGCLVIHGAFCFIPLDSRRRCSFPTSFIWVTVPLLWYLGEKMYREINGWRKIKVSKIILHPSHVIEFQFQGQHLMPFRPGQYVYIKVPSISCFQWHPYTITSAPEDRFLSVHIRVCGDWTRRLHLNLGLAGNAQPHEIAAMLPRICIDSSYGSSFASISSFSVLILIGAGIGQTPFASILRSIIHTAKRNSSVTYRKVYFIGICRHTTAFEWFHEILSEIEELDLDNLINITLYLTGSIDPSQLGTIMYNDNPGVSDAITGLRSPTQFGRPNFQLLFRDIARAHPPENLKSAPPIVGCCSSKKQQEKIGTFYCGPPSLGDHLSAVVQRHNASNPVKLVFSRESI